MDLPTPLPLLLALSPALVAIALALSTRKIVWSLLAGVVAGAIVAHLDQVVTGQVFDATTTFVAVLVDAVVPGLSSFDVNLDGKGSLLFGTVEGDLSTLDTSHLVITAFSLLVAGMVGVLGRSGATRALVRLVEGLARGPRGAMVSAWIAGGLVFFDDYANCLVVGSSMGPLFDRFRVSRAKLAYIVDSTAAPVASLALVSTWVGYEVGLLGDELLKAGSDAPAFTVFLEALPYRFYGFITLAMVGAVAFSGKDFGPMLAAERVARRATRPQAEQDEPRTTSPWVAVITVGGLLVVTFTYLIANGTLAVAKGRGFFEALFGTAFFDVIGSADPFAAMFWGSLVALALAVGLAVSTGAMQARFVGIGIWRGMLPVVEALGVLFLAWALGNAMARTGAADALSELVAPTDTVVYEGVPLELSWHAVDEGRRGTVEVVDVGGEVVYSEILHQVASGPGRTVWDGELADGTMAGLGNYQLRVDVVDKDGEAVKVLVRGQDRFPAWLLPAVVFLVAAGTAFATGTSFGTMGILIPLAVPLGVWLEAGDPGPILLGSVAAVLAGAILGDHASPISDTTVLSALGAGVDLVTHVRTQLPYALLAGFLSIVAGYVPAGLGVSPWILVPIGCALAILAVWVFGRRPEPPSLTEGGRSKDEDLLHREIEEVDEYERV